MSRKIELKGLKGLKDLSNKDYKIWYLELIKAGKLDKYSTIALKERLYRNQQFVKKYGEQAFKSLNKLLRDAYELALLNHLNDALINKTTYEWANPFNEDGTVDPNKGVGNADLFYEIMGWDPAFQKKLYESDYKTSLELKESINKENKKIDDIADQTTKNPFLLEQGAYATTHRQTIKEDSEKHINKLNNTILDKVRGEVAKDRSAKALSYLPLYTQELNLYNDKEIELYYHNAITPSTGNLGIPALATFYNLDDHSIISDEVSDIDRTLKIEWVAKHKLYTDLYGPKVAASMLDAEAREYIDSKQNIWNELQNKWGWGLLTTASKGVANFANGIRNWGIQAGEQLGLYNSPTITVYSDLQGNYYEKENVFPVLNNEGTYIDCYINPYTKEQIPVFAMETLRSNADLLGINSDGNKRDLFFNNNYWRDVELTNHFDPTIHNLAKKLNGYSPYRNIHKLGEEDPIWMETVPQVGWVLADLALTFASMGTTKVATTGVKWAFNGISKAVNSTKRIGSGLMRAENFVSKLTPAISSIGMGHDMGRSVYADALQSNVGTLENTIYNQALTEYQSIMSPTSENNEERAAILNQINDEYKIAYKNWELLFIEQNKKYPQELISDDELLRIQSLLLQQVTLKVADLYILSKVEEYKLSDKYKEQLLEAADIATNSYMTMATTNAVKGAFSNYGFRNYLFKNKTQRQMGGMKDALERRTVGSNGRLLISDVYDNVSKGLKLKNLGKAALKQATGEFADEAFDEIQTFASLKVNTDMMQAYINNEFEAEGEAQTYNLFHGISSYFQGAVKGLSEELTYLAGLLGAVAGVGSVSVNPLLVLDPNFKLHWKNAKSPMEKFNLLFTNGVINTYYDAVHGERDAKELIRQANDIIENEDLYKAISKLLTLDLAKLGTNNGDELEALDFMQAVQSMLQLHDFSNDKSNSLLMEVLKDNNVFKTAFLQVDKITSGKYTEKEAKDMLTEYYAKNPSVPQSEKNSKKALEQITLNATKLKKGVEIVNQVNDKLSSYEKKTGKKVSPLVRALLAERLALDQFLEERIADNEEKISGNKTVNTLHNAASYGTREGVKNRISDLDHSIVDYTDIVEERKKSISTKKAELELYIDSLKDKDELTSEEQDKLSDLMQEHKAMELDLKIAEANRNRVVTERNSLMLLEESWLDGKVMSKEEILAAHPEDRARMLSKSNRYNYSAELLEQIDLARDELFFRDNNLVYGDNIILQLAINVNTHSQNKLAMSSIMEDPEAALVNMMTRISYSEIRAANDRHNTQSIDSWVKHIEEDPNTDPALHDQIIYLGLLKNNNIIDGIYRYKRGTTYNKYRHVLDKAKKANEILKVVKNYVNHEATLKTPAVLEILGTINGILQHTSDEKEVIEKLELMVSDQNVPAETRERLSKVLDVLEEVYLHLSKATRATKEQKEKAQKEKEAKKQAEEAERLKREEEIVKLQEEEKNKKEEERLLREKEIAEREAYGLSEEDAESKEAKLTPELILEGVDNGEVVELESPSIDEQINSDASGDVSKMIAPTTDTSTLDAEVKKSETGIYIGNPLYRYDKDDARIGIQRKRVGSKPNDPMNRRFAWFENEGIKLLEIIDSELHHLVKLGVKIHPLTINPQDNATNDITFKDDVLWVVEYTDQVKKIHNNDLGGVITANGKLFLIIGQAGHDGKSTELFDSFNYLRNPQKRKRNDYFRTNPSERFYVDTSVYTQVKSISSGYLVKQQSTDTESGLRPVTELLEGNRNPRGNKVGIEDLKWGIALALDVTGNNMITVNISEEQKAKMRAVKTNRPGATYLFVEAADGKLTPVYIKPLFLSEIRNGALKDEIVTLVNDLSSMDHAVRLKAVNLLSYYLTFSKNKDLILVGTPSKPTVSILRNGTIVKSFDLTQPNARTELVQFVMEEFNPRINIIAPYLKDETMIEKYAEAGALDTDIAQLGTSNASYTVYTIGENSKPEMGTIVDSTSPNVGGSDLFDSVATDVYSTTYHGQTAVKDSNGNWKLNGKKVTDASILSLLEHHLKLNARNLQPVKTTTEGDIYIMNSDANNPLLYIKKGDYIRTAKGDEAKKLLKEITEELEEVARQERIKAEQEKENVETASNIDISNIDNTNNNTQEENEVLSDEELLKLLLGVFEDSPKEKSLDELKAEDKVDLIVANSEKFELTEDENFYRNTETGELYARVTSIEHADANSKPEDRFDSNNPYGLPSTSIGNGIDEFIRDFFDGTLGNIDNLSDRYPNATTEDLLELLGQLNTLKRLLSEKGIRIIPKGVVATGTVLVTDKLGNKKSLKVAGTLDLLGYDADGNFYVFDIKTNRSIPNPDSTFGRKKISNWSKQISLYKEFLEKQYHIEVKSLEVIPIKVNYPTPVGATDRQGVGATEYTNEGNLLYANGVEFREAKPKLHSNIPLLETTINVQYEKLLPHELALVLDLAESKNTPSTLKPSLLKTLNSSDKDVNNANASLAKLLAESKLSTPEDILCSVEYGGRFLAILEKKIQEGWPAIEDMDVLNDFLAEKGIEVTNIITSPDVWLDMVENCR